MYYLIFIFVFTAMFGITYQEREYVTEEDQNITRTTCYTGNDYDVDDIWKLSDWNGSLNGGHYNIVHIEMSASW